jgi:hypothetical protein
LASRRNYQHNAAIHRIHDDDVFFNDNVAESIELGQTLNHIFRKLEEWQPSRYLGTESQPDASIDASGLHRYVISHEPHLIARQRERRSCRWSGLLHICRNYLDDLIGGRVNDADRVLYPDVAVVRVNRGEGEECRRKAMQPVMPRNTATDGDAKINSRSAQVITFPVAGDALISFAPLLRAGLQAGRALNSVLPLFASTFGLLLASIGAVGALRTLPLLSLRTFCALALFTLGTFRTAAILSLRAFCALALLTLGTLRTAAILSLRAFFGFAILCLALCTISAVFAAITHALPIC